jgi:hypothetical protein
MVQIEKILGVDQWKNDHGTMFTFKMVLSNGKHGEVNAKTEDRYREGETVWVIDEQDGKYGFKWRLSKQDPSANSYASNGQNSASTGNGNKDLKITTSWAIGQVLNAQPHLLEDDEELSKQASKLILLHEKIYAAHDNG